MIGSGENFAASASVLLEKILSLILKKNKDQKASIDDFAKLWLDDYLKALKSNNKRVVKGLITHVNPILCKLDTQIVSLLMSKVLLSIFSLLIFFK